MITPNYHITDKLKQTLRDIWVTSKSIQKMPQFQAKQIIVENLQKTVYSQLVQNEKIPETAYRRAINYILSDILTAESLHIEHIIPLYRIFDKETHLSKDFYEILGQILSFYNDEEYVVNATINAALLHYMILSHEAFPSYLYTMARLLAFAALLRGGFDKNIYFSLEEKIEQNPQNYKKSVTFAKENNDYTKAILFFAQLISASIQGTKERFSKETQMKDIHKDILDFIQKNQLNRFTARDIRKLMQKDMRTIRRYLKEMVDIALLQKH